MLMEFGSASSSNENFEALEQRIHTATEIHCDQYCEFCFLYPDKLLHGRKHRGSRFDNREG